MTFDDLVVLPTDGGGTIEYGIVNGNDTVVFIKAGAGGDCFGFQNKYLRLAHALHDACGCCVICAPNESKDSFAGADAELLRATVASKGAHAKLFYVGVSNGATQGLLDATRYFSFQRMLLINMPLMINFHKTKAALQRYAGQAVFVFGEKDPSYAYVPFLRNMASDHVTVETVPGADHQFSGMLDAFLALAGKVVG